MDDLTTFFCEKKKDLKIRFLEYGGAVKTRRSVLTYIYIIYYIKRRERRKHPTGDNYTHRFDLIFLFETKKFLTDRFL